jgi:hypothetical protein
MFWLSIGGMYVVGKYQLNKRLLLPLNATCPAGTGVVTAAAAVDGALFNSTAVTSLSGYLDPIDLASNVTSTSLFSGMSATTQVGIANVTSALGE